MDNFLFRPHLVLKAKYHAVCSLLFALLLLILNAFAQLINIGRGEFSDIFHWCVLIIQVNFLTQTRLSHHDDGPKAAKRLIDIYFALFKVVSYDCLFAFGLQPSLCCTDSTCILKCACFSAVFDIMIYFFRYWYLRLDQLSITIKIPSVQKKIKIPSIQKMIKTKPHPNNKLGWTHGCYQLF